MGRDDDALPEIEVLGPAGSTAPPTVVQRGGPGRGPSRRRLALVGDAVVVVLAAGFVLGGGGDDDGKKAAPPASALPPRPPTTESARTAPTRTTAVLGPIFDAPTGITLLLADGARGWTAIDADTGSARKVDLGPTDLGYGGIAATRRVVLVNDDRQVSYRSVGPENPTSAFLGEADQVFRAAA